MILGSQFRLFADHPLDTVRPFLQTHCVRCHGSEKQENEKRFDNLPNDLSTIEAVQAWQGILDQLNLGEMPPEDEPQPDAKASQGVIQVLTTQLHGHTCAYA